MLLSPPTDDSIAASVADAAMLLSPPTDDGDD
jgi:hypothetical protein